MIHRYWTGDTRPPAEPWLGELLHHMYRGQLHDWTDGSLPAEAHRQLAGDPLARDPRHRANVVRWTLLDLYGGTWLDHDLIPLRRLPPGAWTATLRHSRTACAISVPAGHPLPRAMLTAIDDAPRAPADRAVDISGDLVLQRVATRYSDLGAQPLPYDALGRPVAGGRLWAIHLWSTSARLRLQPPT